MEGLRREFAGIAGVNEVRGRGLMLGVELDRPCGDLVRRGLEAGLVINVTADRVVRMLPPLIFGDAESRELVARVGALVKTFLAEAPPAAA
jgi:acetylornithine aminotransferase